MNDNYSVLINNIFIYIYIYMVVDEDECRQFRVGIPLNIEALKQPPRPIVLGNGLNNVWLVVTGTMEFYDFPIILGIVTPTDFHIFQMG